MNGQDYSWRWASRRVVLRAIMQDILYIYYSQTPTPEATQTFWNLQVLILARSLAKLLFSLCVNVVTIWNLLAIPKIIPVTTLPSMEKKQQR